MEPLHLKSVSVFPFWIEGKWFITYVKYIPNAYANRKAESKAPKRVPESSPSNMIILIQESFLNINYRFVYRKETSYTNYRPVLNCWHRPEAPRCCNSGEERSWRRSSVSGPCDNKHKPKRWVKGRWICAWISKILDSHFWKTFKWDIDIQMSPPI